MQPVVSKDRWKNRRRMAWISLIASLLYPLLMLYTDSVHLGNIAGPFYLFTGSVVGAYIGFATMDDKWTQLTDNYSTTATGTDSASAVDRLRNLDIS